MEVDVSYCHLRHMPLATMKLLITQYYNQDPNDTVQYAVGMYTSSVPFICPASGQVRCEANFNDNNDGPNYSLRGM